MPPVTKQEIYELVVEMGKHALAVFVICMAVGVMLHACETYIL